MGVEGGNRTQKEGNKARSHSAGVQGDERREWVASINGLMDTQKGLRRVQAS